MGGSRNRPGKGCNLCGGNGGGGLVEVGIAAALSCAAVGGNGGTDGTDGADDDDDLAAEGWLDAASA